MSEGFLTRLALATPFIDDQLISPLQYQRIHAAAQQLPNVGKGMFEFRLNPYSEEVDFGVVLDSDQAFSKMSLQNIPSYWPEILQKKWQHIKALCQRKSNAEAYLRDALYAISIAYDLRDASVPFPWLYYSLSPTIGIPAIRGILTEKLLKEEEDYVMGPTQRSLLDKVLHALPPTTSMVHVAHISVRPAHQLRLVASPFKDGEHLWRLMSMIDMEPWEFLDKKELGDWCKLSQFCQISLDLGLKVDRKVGLEFWFPEELSYVQLINLIQHFPGFPLTSALKEQLAVWIQKENTSSTRRWLNHIKLTVNGKGQREWKFYLSFM